MSGPQHIAWYETAVQETGASKLIDLQVVCAPNKQENLDQLRESLAEMARGKNSE